MRTPTNAELEAECAAVERFVRDTNNASGTGCTGWDWDCENKVLTITEDDGSTTTISGADIAAACPGDTRLDRLREPGKTVTTKTKTKRVSIPKTDVLAWLNANHPALHQSAEIDREWVWITANLKGSEHDATRESIKKFGFIFAKRGGHHLPSGKLGTWGHSCTKPLPFKRRGSKPTKAEPKTTAAHTEQPEPEAQPEDAEALAFALG